MTQWDFFQYLVKSYGGIFLLLALICALLVIICYLLIKWFMLPKIKKFIDDFDLFRENVDKLGDSIIRIESETKATNEKVELINGMNHEAITEMKIIIIEMRESIHDLGKTVNKILKEHYRNHPEK